MAWCGEVLVLYSKLACLYIPATPTRCQWWGRGTLFFSLDYVVYNNVSYYVVVDECGTCSQLGVAELSISQSSRAFHPVILLITTCGHVLYHYPQHPHTLWVCARLYFIEDLCSLPFCTIVRVSCVVCVATRQLRYKWSQIVEIAYLQ